MRLSRFQWLLSGAAVLGLIVGIRWDMMTGFWAWVAANLALVLIWAAINHSKMMEALETSPLRITSWAIFVILTVMSFFTFREILAFPDGPSVILGILTSASLWWTYYTLEPVKA